MISKMVMLARQSVEPKYLRMTTTDLCQQELFCRGQLSAIIAARELPHARRLPLDGSHRCTEY
jgi:hypothetical protein